MNKQKRGNSKGIEWTDYTWNPIAGCAHDCRWAMPDGTVAQCYAKDAAEGVASRVYPHGFRHHYWHLDRLTAPLLVKKPSKIFLDSMSDLMGHWVPNNQIKLVLNAVDNARWHTFQLLTKNAPRLKFFDFPPNVWVGVSSPPDWMFGRLLTPNQQRRMLHKSLKTLSHLNNITWMSFEPLSWDVSGIVAQYLPHAIDWAVIGAASNGPKTFQPNPFHVQALLNMLDEWGIPVFFKGNLDWEPRREEFPKV